MKYHIKRTITFEYNTTDKDYVDMTHQDIMKYENELDIGSVLEILEDDTTSTRQENSVTVTCTLDESEL